MSVVDMKFVWREDEEYGGEGWIPKLMPKFNASQGLGVAHDAMEHFDVTAGTLEEEILAFGSMVYLRVETGWFYGQGSLYPPATILAGDLSRFLSDRWHGGGMLRNVKGRPRHLEDDMEQELEEIVAQTRRHLREDLDDADWRRFQHDTIDVWNRLKRWMRQGYWQSKRRYRDARNYELAYCFTTIQNTVDKMKHIELGEELHVKVTVSDGRARPTIKLVRLEELYPEDEYN